MLIIICLYLYFTHYPQDGAHLPENADRMLDLYRIAIFISFLTFLVSINIFIWTKSHINYQYILKIEPRPYFSKWYTLCFSLAIFVTIMISLMFYIVCVGYDAKGVEGFSNEWIHPTVLYIVLVMWMLFPLRFFFSHIRFWIIGSIWRCACAPFAKVQFQDIFMGIVYSVLFSSNYCIADILTSMGDILFEVQFAACLYPVHLESRMFSS